LNIPTLQRFEGCKLSQGCPRVGSDANPTGHSIFLACFDNSDINGVYSFCTSFGANMSLPTGTVTFLFTDIEGSTKLLESLGDEYARVLRAHHGLVRTSIEKFGGYEVDTQGDSFFVAFSRAVDAAAAAVEIQRSLLDQEWPGDYVVRVRMGLHTGEPELTPGGYVGMDIHRAARISDAGHGGQILLSAATEQLLRGDVPEGASLIYLGQHQLKDLSRPDHLFELKVKGLPSNFPPLRTLDAKRTNLPIQATSFIGREAELREISELLRNPSCRLLTLVGPGGIGKSRLALQAAAQLSDEFPDGTYLISLESISSPDLILTAIADALNFDLDTTSLGGSAEEQLVGYMQGRSALLLLDNFEHLIAGAMFLSDMVEKVSAAKFMVTSRERLNVTSEWTFDVLGLDERRAAEIEDPKENAAIKLFLERARQSDAGFKMTDGEAPHVRHICQLVGGMPLAIELAASWVRMLTPEEISKKIEGGIEFLASSMKDLPSRHRSILSVLDYSWELLTDEERSCLMNLSVFRGGFTLERGQLVGKAGFETIAGLVDKSQLKRGSEGRFEMHGLSRQYAMSKLKENLDIERQILSLHASVYSELLNQWERELKDGKRGEFLHEFTLEIGNIRAAWEWAVRETRGDLILKSMESLWMYYETRSWFQEGFDAFGLAEESFEKSSKGSYQPGIGALLCKLYARQGWFAWRLGKYRDSQVIAERSLELAVEAASNDDQAFSRLLVGILGYAQGELGEAKGYLEESLNQWREVGDRWGIATTLFYLGLVAHSSGDFGEMLEPYQYGLELFKDAGYQYGATFSHTSVGRVVQSLGDYMKAKQMCEESLAIRREMGDSWGVAACLDSLGVLECGLGELDRAMEVCLESLKIRESLGDRKGVATSLNNLSHVAYLRGELETAIRYCDEGLAIRREMGNRRGMSASLNFLGLLASAQNENPKAKEYLVESLEVRRNLGDRTGTIDSLNDLGSIDLAMGNVEEAWLHYSEAFTLATEIDATPLSLEALFGLAKCFLEKGETMRAVETLSLVAHHRASPQEIKSKAQELFQTLSEGRDDSTLLDAWKQGATRRVDEVASLLE
jgi:predicted ATPase/class 3 adenylate cyclase